MAQEIKISNVLSAYQGFITYIPMSGEVPVLDYLSLPPEAIEYKITPRASLDPKREADAARRATRDIPGAVLIPGQRFDATGTRHGRGGGWYDRFLGFLPKNWLRVGFCYRGQFSEETLVREPWDQPMDYVCVAEGDSLTVYVTKARNL